MKYTRIIFLVLSVFSFSALFSLLLSSCDRSEPSVTGSLLPDEDLSGDTRVTMDNIIAIARTLAEGEVFHLLVYRLDDADNEVNPTTGGQLYASSVCTLNNGLTVDFITTYAPGDTNQTDQPGLNLPTGNYRLCVYMTPDTDADTATDPGDAQSIARLVANPTNRTLMFDRGVDLLAVTKDINIPRRTDTSTEHTVVVDWSGAVFSHQSSKIDFKIEHKTPAIASEKLHDPITVSKIEVSSLTPKGISTFSLLESNALQIFSTIPVDASNRTGKVELVHQEDNTDYQFTYAADTDGYPNTVVTTYPFLIIPQADLAGILIKITLQTDLLGDEEMTLSAVSQMATYLPNMAYTFTLQIDKERPVLLCTVAPWYEGTGNNQDNSAADIEDDGDFNTVTPGFMVEGWKINNSSNENNVGQE